MIFNEAHKKTEPQIDRPISDYHQKLIFYRQIHIRIQFFGMVVPKNTATWRVLSPAIVRTRRHNLAQIAYTDFDSSGRRGEL